jgi:hypothetical protein
MYFQRAATFNRLVDEFLGAVPRRERPSALPPEGARRGPRHSVARQRRRR